MAYYFSSPIKKPKAPTLSAKRLTKPGYHFLQHHEIDSSWFSDIENLRWCEDPVVCPPGPGSSDLYGSIRGCDEPRFHPSTKVSDTLPSEAPSKAIMVIESLAEPPAVFGNKRGDIDDFGGRLEFYITCESQLPSLIFTYAARRPDGKAHRYRVQLFGNQTMSSVHVHKPQDVQSKHLRKVPYQLQECAQTGHVMAVQLTFRDLIPSGDPWEDRFDARLYSSFGMMYRNDDDRWQTAEDFRKSYDGFFTPPEYAFDAAIRRLLFSQKLIVTFFQFVKIPLLLNIDTYWSRAYNYWQYCMEQTCANGPFWFYVVQPGFRGFGGPFTYNVLRDSVPIIPFWLIRKCRIHINDEGRLDYLEPLTWAPIVGDRENRRDTRLPNPDCVALLAELSRFHKQGYEDTPFLTAYLPSYERSLLAAKVRTIGTSTIWELKIHESLDKNKAHFKGSIGRMMLRTPGTILDVLITIDGRSITMRNAEVLLEPNMPHFVEAMAECALDTDTDSAWLDKHSVNDSVYRQVHITPRVRIFTLPRPARPS